MLPFPRLCWSLFCHYCLKKLTERAPSKMGLRVLSIINQYAITCMGTSTVCLHPIKSLYLLSTLYVMHSPDKLFQVLSRFSILQAIESWAGPGNKAKTRLIIIDPNSGFNYSIAGVLICLSDTDGENVHSFIQWVYRQSFLNNKIAGRFN